MRVCLPPAAFCKQREKAHDGHVSDALRSREVALFGREKRTRRLTETRRHGDTATRRIGEH